MIERNLDGLPEKYFTVPPCEEIDLEAHGILMEQVEVLNKLIADASDGCAIVADDYWIACLSNIMSSLLFQAKLIMEAEEK